MHDTDEVRALEKTLSNLEKELAELNARVPATPTKPTATVAPAAFNTRVAELRKSGLSPTKAMEAARREQVQKDNPVDTTNETFEQLVKCEVAASGGYMPEQVARQRVFAKYGANPPAEAVDALRKSRDEGDAAAALLRRRYPDGILKNGVPQRARA